MTLNPKLTLLNVPDENRGNTKERVSRIEAAGVVIVNVINILEYITGNSNGTNSGGGVDGGDDSGGGVFEHITRIWSAIHQPTR